MFINHLSNLVLQLVLVELDTVLHSLKGEFNQWHISGVIYNLFQLCLCQVRTPHIGPCDGHTLGLDGGLPGYAGPSLLQRQLPVREPESLSAAGPRSTGPVAVAGCHVHVSHQVGQLPVELRVRLCPAGGVLTHGGGCSFTYSWTSLRWFGTRGGITALRRVGAERETWNHTHSQVQNHKHSVIWQLFKCKKPNQYFRVILFCVFTPLSDDVKLFSSSVSLEIPLKQVSAQMHLQAEHKWKSPSELEDTESI